MKKLFSWIGGLIEKRPARVLLIITIIFALLIVGVSNIRMATGNETLVQSENEVYKSNKEMETAFGGESILVLFKDDTGDNLLSIDNIHKM